MSRVIASAESVKAEIIVGITGDCPVIDPIILNKQFKPLFIINVTMSIML